MSSDPCSSPDASQAPLAQVAPWSAPTNQGLPINATVSVGPICSGGCPISMSRGSDFQTP